MITKITKKLNILKRGLVPYEAEGFRSGFPGSETWRSVKHVLTRVKTSPSSTTGFVILFAVTLSAIILSITLGIANIALNEIKFGTSAKDTNEAFFAADTGRECALFNDKSTSTIFVSPPTGSMQCLGRDIPVDNSDPIWMFNLSGLGSQGHGCAKIKVDKTLLTSTIITSNGYNNGGDTLDACNPTANSVAREIKQTY